MKIKEIITEKTTATPLGSLKNQPGFAQGFISGLVPGAGQAFQQSRRDSLITSQPYNLPTDANVTTAGNTTSSTDNINPGYQQAQQQAQQLAQRAAQYKPAKLGQVNNSRGQDNSYDVTLADGNKAIVRVGYKDDQGREYPSRVTMKNPNTNQPESYSYDKATRQWRKVGGGEDFGPEMSNDLNALIQDVSQQVQQINAQAAAQQQQQRAATLAKSRQRRKQRLSGTPGVAPAPTAATNPPAGTA